MKVCYACKGDPQPLEHFYRDRSQRDGHDQLCKVHRRAVADKFRAGHRDQERARAVDSRRRTIALPPRTLAPGAIVALGDARYRIQRVEAPNVLLSSGRWVDQRLVT